jgi:hypothetical protein
MYEEHGPSRSDWAFVVACVLLLVVIAAVPFLLLGSAITLVAGLVR